MLGQVIHTIFYIYTALLFARLIGSWFPSIHRHPWMAYVARLTDPYLGIFRRVIPPIGGVLDFSPILGFLTLQFLEFFLRYFLESLSPS